MQAEPLACYCGKPFSPGKAVRCRCVVLVCTPCAKMYPQNQVGARVFKIPCQIRTREPADTDLQGVSFLDPVLVNGKRVDFHMFILSGSDR